MQVGQSAVDPLDGRLVGSAPAPAAGFGRDGNTARAVIPRGLWSGDAEGKAGAAGAFDSPALGLLGFSALAGEFSPTFGKPSSRGVNFGVSVPCAGGILCRHGIRRRLWRSRWSDSHLHLRKVLSFVFQQEGSIHDYGKHYSHTQRPDDLPGGKEGSKCSPR